MNLRQIYTNAGRLVNLIAESEELEGSALQIAADCMTMLMEMWSINPRIQFKRTNWDIDTDGSSPIITLPSRPIRIHSASWTYSAGSVYYQLNPIDEITYSQISFRNVTAPPSQYVWNHESSVTLYPTPTAGTLHLLVEVPLIIDTTDYDTDLSLPQGYAAALVYSLAAMLLDQYGKPDDSGIRQNAVSMVEAIQVQNQRVETMKMHTARIFNGHSGYVPLINRP